MQNKHSPLCPARARKKRVALLANGKPSTLPASPARVSTTTSSDEKSMVLTAFPLFAHGESHPRMRKLYLQNAIPDIRNNGLSVKERFSQKIQRYFFIWPGECFFGLCFAFYGLRGRHGCNTTLHGNAKNGRLALERLNQGDQISSSCAVGGSSCHFLERCRGG